jgi:hypothetical protein
MWMRCLLLCVLSLAILSGCTPSVSPDHAERLIAARSALLDHPEGDIPAARWPEAVVRLRPERVRRTEEGIYIHTYEFFVEQRGIFILDLASTFVPEPLSDPSYEVVVSGVYLYRSAG